MRTRDGAEAWDAFLDSCPRGQFQQSSGWARVKALDGWSGVRQFLEPGDPSCGGFQLLWKKRGLVRIGYVSKGPVLPVESAAAVGAALDRVVSVARALRLAAVVVQPPDDSGITGQMLVDHGFYPRPLENVIRATGVIDLEGGTDAVVGRMSRTARKHWRTACRQELTLTWGERSDLPRFFQLMCESARRQQAIPNPAGVDRLEQLWDSFPKRVRVAFAEHHGRKVAGLITVDQGKRIIFWKKGWESAGARLEANQFLMTRCLIWASESGYSSVDTMSLSPAIAERLLAGQELGEEDRGARDLFNLRLGARPKLLPPAHLLVANPVMRRVAHGALRSRRIRLLLDRCVG